MTDRGVELAIQPGVTWNPQEDETPMPHQTAEMSQFRNIISDVLEHIDQNS